MVVIPTKTHVTLHYGYTPVDDFGWLLTIAGIIAVIVMWRMGPVIYPSRPAHLRRRWFFLPPLASAPAGAGADANGHGQGVDSADNPDSPEAAYSAALGKQLSGVNGNDHGPPGDVDVDHYWD
jgi:hypothetical protein